ncbi:hypothetical protein B0H11DRAFT_1938500 [Mycena galericulata]|nr:hypothetical protein B0H11DRAFT_1938500 [Mycena galericulata]
MATSVGAASRHPPADREYIHRQPVRTSHTDGIPELYVLFRLHHPQRNKVPRLPQTTAGSGLGASTAFLSTVSDPVRVKIEPVSTPDPPVPVKAEPQSRTLNEGGREVFELLSDSEPDDGKSDAEVMETLQRTTTRPRAPSKRFADGEDISSRPLKKSKFEQSRAESGNDSISAEPGTVDCGMFRLC